MPTPEEEKRLNDTPWLGVLLVTFMVIVAQFWFTTIKTSAEDCFGGRMTTGWLAIISVLFTIAFLVLLKNSGLPITLTY